MRVAAFASLVCTLLYIQSWKIFLFSSFLVKYGGGQAAGFSKLCVSLLLKLSFRHMRAARRGRRFSRKNKRDLFGLRTPPTDMSALRKKSAMLATLEPIVLLFALSDPNIR